MHACLNKIILYEKATVTVAVCIAARHYIDHRGSLLSVQQATAANGMKDVLLNIR